jgi:hypothetical protein
MYFNTPATILQDFDKFLDLLGQSSEVELTKGKGELRNADLLRLNAAMHFRLAIINPKSKQLNFALLNMFFHIARTAELVQIKKDSMAQRCSLTVNPTRVREYDSMNYDEQYFFLLETYWCFLNWREVFDSYLFAAEPFYKEILQQPAGIPVTVSDPDAKRSGKIRGPIDTAPAEIFQAFGLLELCWDEALEKRPSRYIFPYQSVTLTELGKAVLPILFDKRPVFIWGNQDPYATPEIAKILEEHNKSTEDKDDVFSRRFIVDPYITDDELKSVEQPDETTFDAAFHAVMPHLAVEKRLFPIVVPPMPGAYIFRILLKKSCYREIVINGEKTLEDLHVAIQDLFEFDNDHLYAFYLNGRDSYDSSYHVYADPRGGGMNGKKPADCFKINEMGFFSGKEILYLFDFGDNWQFSVTVLDIKLGVEVVEKYKLLKEVGKPPKQYHHWDDDGED